MKTRAIEQAVLLACVLVCWGGISAAQTPSDPIVKFDSESVVELDLAVVVDDLLPLLMEALNEAEAEDREKAGLLIDLLGIEALDRLRMETRTTKKESNATVTLTLDPDRNGGLLAEMLAIPSGKCRFAEFVKKDEMTLFMTVQNLRGHLDLALDFLARPEFAEMSGDLPRNADGELELDGFCPRRDLLPLLSGELDVVLMDVPEGGLPNPMQLPAFLVIGTEDGPALRDLILDLAAGMAGEQEGGFAEMFRSLPPERVGDFELTVIPFGGAYAVSQDFLILGATDDPLRGMLTGTDGDLKIADGRTWMYMDGAKYGRAMEEFMGLAGAFGPQNAPDELEAKWMALMYSNLFEHIESEVIRTTSSPNRLVIEADVDGAVMNGLYGMLHAFMLELPTIMETQRIENERREATADLRQAVSILDDAFAGYGVDHDGLYPAEPRDLVAEGYLAEWPLAESTSAGVYQEGGYTYHPLSDAEGRIAGYFLFVYGGGEGTGFDVYSGGNIQDAGSFTLESDGVPDGVAVFCYDGSALKMMEKWKKK